jgi:DNA-directed RNA polymerase subunit E'/Rpb7
MDIFVTSVLYDKVKLPAAELHSDYQARIEELLKAKVAGKCTRHGLIKLGSIEVLKISLGVVEAQTFKGSVNFLVKFRADVCNPMIGAIVHGKVQNINSFGILCTAAYDYIDDTTMAQKHVVLEIIVPKQSLTLQSEVSLASLKLGQTVNIDVMGKKFQLNDKRISVIGRVVKGSGRGGRGVVVDRDEDGGVGTGTGAGAGDLDDDIEDGAALSEEDEEAAEDSEADEEAKSVIDGDDAVEPARAGVEAGVESDGELVSDIEDDDDVEIGGGDSDFEYED